MKKTVPQRLTIKQRAHLTECGIPITLKAIRKEAKAQLAKRPNDTLRCHECVEIGRRLNAI